VVMPDLTPPAYRQRYEIYPGPARPVESAEDFHEALRRRIEAIGRTIGTGRGDSRNFAARAGRASA
jgi:biotin synthase